jgi:hypothetical protein
MPLKAPAGMPPGWGFLRAVVFLRGLAPHFLLKFSWRKPRYGLFQIKLKMPRRSRSKPTSKL